jgi:hypothetical protein
MARGDGVEIMAKVTYVGLAKADDPMYSDGLIIMPVPLPKNTSKSIPGKKGNPEQGPSKPNQQVPPPSSAP